MNPAIVRGGRTSASYSAPSLADRASVVPLLPDEITLHLIASGLSMIALSASRGERISLPYPAPLQRGLDRLIAAQLCRALPSPQGIPDLLEWCHRPVATWGLTLRSEAVAPGERLLDAGIPPAMCEAWACANPDVEAELSEQHLLSQVFERCIAAQRPDAYVAFRRLLIERPVLTALELQQRCNDPVLAPLIDHLHSAYEPAPRVHAVDGRFNCCPSCGGLLLRTASEQLICEEERCRVTGVCVPTRSLALRDEVLWLKRGLRRFIAAPGRSELRLAARLEALGLRVELWPEFDRYDLRVIFPDTDIWAVDLKDWNNPFLLARRAASIPTTPPWTRAWFVFPEHRRRERSDYLRAFRHHCRVLDARTGAAFEREFILAARRKAQGGR